MLSIQSPRGVVMIRPYHFSPNVDTVQDNSFQTNDTSRTAREIAQGARWVA